MGYSTHTLLGCHGLSTRGVSIKVDSALASFSSAVSPQHSQGRHPHKAIRIAPEVTRRKMQEVMKYV